MGLIVTNFPGPTTSANLKKAVWKATLEKSCVDIDKFQGSSKRTVSCAVVH